MYVSNKIYSSTVSFSDFRGWGGTVISGVQASRLSVPHPWKPGSVEVLLLPTLSPGGATVIMKCCTCCKVTSDSLTFGGQGSGLCIPSKTVFSLHFYESL